MIYLDDILIIGSKIEQTRRFTQMAMSLLESLGFIINKENSILKPTQVLTFLGFTINSVNMTLNLPHDKVTAIQSQCRQLLTLSSVTLRAIAQILGTLGAARPAIWKAPLHYRMLQVQLTQGLQLKSKQLYESCDSITTIQTGAPLVGSEHRIMQWQPCCDSSSRSYHLHGRVETRVGRNLLESTSQREMVCFRETPAHQSFGIEKCFSINSSTD